MDRQLLEIATLFEGKSKPSLPRIARLALIGIAVVLHVFIALFSAIAPNPNKTAIYYAPRVLLMLFGGSGATFACVITYIKLLKCRLNRFVWMLLTVKSAAYVCVVVAATLSQMLMDNLAAAEKAAAKATDEKATGSLQKIVDRDDGKV